ncbi:MAG: MATE family efflux transporter, partial [Gammaproteobacteria bacterium]|nr:MATE family efflux transporter [Gammaproteobacteria bacterium]
VIVSLGIGLMAGTSSVIARAIGRGDQARVRRLTTDALAFSVLISLALSVIGILSLNPLFRLLGASEELLPLISDYMIVWYAGMVAVIPPMAGMGAIRATGDSRFQSRLLIVASVVNLILDPLLIFGLLGFPRLELQGAAIATIAARATTIAAGYWAIRYKHGMLSFDLPKLSEVMNSWSSLLHVGLPAAGTNVIIPASTAVVVAIISAFGHEAVAGFGAASRIEALSLVVFFAMSAVIGPFVGQNLGAGKTERIAEANRRCALFCLLFGLSVAAVLAISAKPLMALFSDDARVREVGSAYLWIVPISYGAAGIVMVVNAAFNGLGRPFPAVAVSTLRMVVLYLPLAWLGAKFFNVHGIFAAAAIANIVAGSVAFAWLRRTAGVSSPQQAPTGDRRGADAA